MLFNPTIIRDRDLTHPYRYYMHISNSTFVYDSDYTIEAEAYAAILLVFNALGMAQFIDNCLGVKLVIG